MMLFLRLAFAVRHFGVFVGGLRMAVGPRRFFAPLAVFAFAVMFGSRPVALGGAFVVFRSLVMSVFGHVSPRSFSCD